MLLYVYDRVGYGKPIDANLNEPPRVTSGADPADCNECIAAIAAEPLEVNSKYRDFNETYFDHLQRQTTMNACFSLTISRGLHDVRDQV